MILENNWLCKGNEFVGFLKMGKTIFLKNRHRMLEAVSNYDHGDANGFVITIMDRTIGQIFYKKNGGESRKTVILGFF